MKPLIASPALVGLLLLAGCSDGPPSRDGRAWVDKNETPKLAADE
jgi:hypothetical protein